MSYTEFRPRWHRPRMSTTWWAERPTYTLFILRELSSVAVAWLVVFLLLLVRAVGNGPQSYQDFLNWADHPVVIALNLVALAFLLLHTVTWFNLTPAAMVVKFRGKRLPPAALVAPNYLGWAVVTAFVAWLVTK